MAPAPPYPLAGRNKKSFASRPAARERPRQGGGPVPLRFAGGVLSPMAGQSIDLLLWLLSAAGRRPGGRSNAAAGVLVSQITAQGRRSPPRRGLRLGRLRTLCR